MEKSVNNLILEKIDDIVDMIQDSKEYHDYQILYQKLKKNQKVNDFIVKVKDIQKTIVQRQVRKEPVENLESELNSCLKQLERIPLYTEFVEKQQELNEVYQTVKEELDRYFYNTLN